MTKTNAQPTKANQAALITGSSRGIGLATAVELAKQGFSIALNGPVDDDELQMAAEKIAALNVPIVKIIADVSDLGLHDKMLDQAEAAIGPLTTLVNNAGVSVLNRGDPLEITEESFDRCMIVNAKAQFFLSQAWAKRLVEREKFDDLFYSLINVTSSNATAVAEPRGEYCISKAAAAMSTQLFAVRLGREGIAVYDIRPGLIETAMTKTVTETYQNRIDDEQLTLIPRLGQPEDMGRIMATLACGHLPYTTGQVISADAGMLVSRF